MNIRDRYASPEAIWEIVEPFVYNEPGHKVKSCKVELYAVGNAIYKPSVITCIEIFSVIQEHTVFTELSAEDANNLHQALKEVIDIPDRGIYSFIINIEPTSLVNIQMEMIATLKSKAVGV